MKKLAVIGLVLIGLVSAGSAQARPFEAAEEAAYAEALAWWGEEPTLCASIVKKVEPVEIGWGSATQPIAPETACSLRIDPEVLEQYGMLCAVMRHEVGHLLGHDHVDDPTNIMYPVLSIEAVPDCFPPRPPMIIAPEEPPAAPEETAAPVENIAPSHPRHHHKHRRGHHRHRHHHHHRPFVSGVRVSRR